MAGKQPPPPCDAPPPDAGPVHRPAHPLYGIAFLYAVSETLLWGARAGDVGTVARLGVAHAGLGICLVGAVHLIEGVELRHVLGKLGALRAPRTGVGIAIIASLPAGIALARGLAGQRTAMPAAVLGAALAAVWQEGFYRGLVFRSLMRRHGFVVSAGVAALLLAADCVLASVQRGTGLGALVLRGLLELPLSFALSSLFWLGQSLWPGVVVRFAVLAATAVSGAAWPAGLVALLLWILQAVSRLRERTASA